MGYGDNAKAAVITRGLAEITRLGVKLGADPLTYSGLSGVGDLIVTGTSIHSRNWRAGDALGRGEKLEDIERNMGMVIEEFQLLRLPTKSLKNSMSICQLQQQSTNPSMRVLTSRIYSQYDVQWSAL